MNATGDKRMRCQLQYRFCPAQHFSLTLPVVGAIASQRIRAGSRGAASVVWQSEIRR